MNLILSIIAVVVFVVSFELGGVLIENSETYKLGEIAQQEKAKCELELPRNQTCKIIAVRDGE